MVVQYYYIYLAPPFNVPIFFPSSFWFLPVTGASALREPSFHTYDLLLVQLLISCPPAPALPSCSVLTPRTYTSTLLKLSLEFLARPTAILKNLMRRNPRHLESGESFPKLLHQSQTPLGLGALKLIVYLSCRGEEIRPLRSDC